MSISLTRADTQESSKSPLSVKKISSDPDEPVISQFHSLCDYKRINGHTLFPKIEKPIASSSGFLILDYIGNPKILETINKYKKLNSKKEALTKKPIAPIPTHLEIQFNKRLKESFLSLFIPDNPAPIKRSQSSKELTVKAPSNNSPTREKPPAANPFLKEGGFNFKRPRRYDIQRKASDQLSHSSGSFSTENTFISSRSSSRSGKESFLENNFVPLDRIFDIIFFSDNQENMPPLLIAPDKLKKILLVTYEVAIAPEVLLEELSKKLSAFEEKRKEQSNISESIRTKSSQIAILMFLKSWIKERPDDFKQNERLLNSLKRLLMTVALQYKTGLQDVLRSFKRYMDKISPPAVTKDQPEKKSSSQKSEAANMQSSGLTKKTRLYFNQIHQELNLLSLKNIHEIFMIVPSFEIAKQFCIFDSKLVSQIKLQDLRGTKPKKETSAYSESGSHFNYLTLFIIFLILKVENKGPLISKLIYIANSLYELRDYQGFVILMTGLTHALVSRYVNSIVDTTDKETYQIKTNLEQLFDKVNGYKNLKRAINHSTFPMVPFIPGIASDVLKIDAAHEVSIMKTDDEISVNLKKLEMVFNSYQNLYLSKFSTYDFEPIKIFQEFLSKSFKDVLFCYTETQNIYEIEDIFDDRIKAQTTPVNKKTK